MVIITTLNLFDIFINPIAAYFNLLFFNVRTSKRHDWHADQISGYAVSGQL